MMPMRAVLIAAVAGGLGTGLVAQNPAPTHDGKAVVNGAPIPSGKRAMTFADLMAMKRVSDPQISASGRWVLFSVTDVDLEKNTKTSHLWVVPLGGEADSSASDPAVRDRMLRNDKGGSSRATPTSQNRDVGHPDSAERQVTFGAGESFGRFSPDGKQVSWTQNPGKDESFARIVVAAWDETTGMVGAAAKALTGVSGDADGAVWSPDSRRVMFTTEVYPECSVKGGASTEADSSASLRNDKQKTNTEILTPPERGQNDAAIEVSGTRDVAAWKTMQPAGWAEEDACDKAKDAAAEKNPVKAQVWDGLLYRHWDHWTGAKRTHILVKDFMENAVSRAISKDQLSADSLKRPANPDGLEPTQSIRDVTTARDVGDAETPTYFTSGPQEYAWSPDSKEIAYVTNLDAVPAASTNNDVFTLRLDEAGARPVKVSTSAGSDDEPEYSPDGRWLAFRSQRQTGFESDRERLMLVERVSRSASQQVSGREWGEPKELTPKFDGWVDEFTWSPDSQAIYFAAGNSGEEPLFRLFVPSAAVQQFANVGEYSDLRVSTDGKLLVASRMTIDAPTEIIELETGEAIKASPDAMRTGTTVSGVQETGLIHAVGEAHINGALLSQLNLSPLEPFWFTGAEGTKVEGFLLKPPGFDAAKKYPVKFLLHGGPQTAWGDAWSYRWNWELMAASGYVVIGINRRGSTGYGQKFVDEVSGDWGGRAYEDLMKGLDYAEANFPFIDKTRECALGASYGGYMADWVLTHTDRFKCIVTHDGLYDPESAYGTTEEMWFPEWEFRRPEDFPKGWDGFTGGYRLGGREADSSASGSRRTLRNDNAKANTEVLRSAQDDGGLGAARSGRDDGGLVSGQPDPTHAHSSRVNGAPGEKQRGSPSRMTNKASGMTNQGESGSGHAAEPWRYAGLPASEDPFRKWSPKEYIQNARTPTLVIHSQRDYRLDVSQGFELYTALQRMGVPSRFLYFPDEGHWVLKPQNSELWNAVVSDWCDRWTKSGKYAEN